MRKAIAERLQNCGLELHPEKTKIVYCKDDDRQRNHLNEKFDFLGYSVLQKHTVRRDVGVGVFPEGEEILVDRG